jgi:hypothetical protein
MRALARLGVAIAFVVVMLVSAHSAAEAFGINLKMSAYYGRAAASFQYTYSLNRLAGDGACPQMDLAVTWDDEKIDSVPLDCSTLSASGTVTPPADRNDLGRHMFCVGNESSGVLVACVPYTIVPEPGECDPNGLSSPVCVVATTTPFEPDCIPTGLPTSPPCVTRTPIPIDCSNPSSPPCAETATPPPPTETPAATCDDAADSALPPCSTPTPAKTATGTPTKTPTRTATPACDGTATPSSGECRTSTSTPTTGSDDTSGGVSVNWTAVAVAAGVVVAVGGAAGGFWWLRLR